MCDVDLEDDEYHLPDLPIPEGFTYETYLRHLTEEGLARLYGDAAKMPKCRSAKSANCASSTRWVLTSTS